MDNPYVYQEPILGQDGFFNRSSEITRISSRVASDRPQSVSIVGGPRMGKTSLVNLLCDPVSQSEFLGDPAQYVCPRLSLGAQSADSPDEFFALFDAELRRCELPGMKPDYDGFNDFVKGLMQEGKKLVVYFDDFGHITGNSNFPLDFFSFMRSVANNYDVGYVTTSHASLHKLSHNQDIEESPFFNIFTTVNLEPFRAADARRLVEEPASRVGSPFTDETEWILKLGGGFPYLLQLTAAIAFERRMGCDQEKLEQLAFDEARDFLQSIWDEFSEPEREVALAISAGNGIDHRYEYAAESLERRGLVTQNGSGYGFGIGLMERFVQGHGKGGLWKKLFGR